MGRLYICPHCRGKGHTHSGSFIGGDLPWDERCPTWVRGVLTREAVLA